MSSPPPASSDSSPNRDYDGGNYESDSNSPSVYSSESLEKSTTPKHPTIPKPTHNPTPAPKPRRVKVLARKSVASCSRAKFLEELLHAEKGSTPELSNESFKSANKDEEPGSTSVEKGNSDAISEINTDQRFVLVGFVVDVEVPKRRRKSGKEKSLEIEGDVNVRGSGEDGTTLAICGPTLANLEEDVTILGGTSGVEEADAGLENLMKAIDEHVSSREETLAERLRKLGDSYNPKKRRTSRSKKSKASVPSKKRKVAGSVKVLVPKVRATRNTVREEEDKLVKALQESKRKRAGKGKAKVGEAVVIEEETLDLVQQDEQLAPVVRTPKPTQAKASSKKLVAVSVATPSTIKRTRSKPKKVKIVTKEDDDADWSGEEEKEIGEVTTDRVAMFGKRTILKGKLMKDFEEPGMRYLLDFLAVQGWMGMVLRMEGRLVRDEVVEFMGNATVIGGRVTSLVKGVEVSFDAQELGVILDIPAEGYEDYTRQRWPCLDGMSSALSITRFFRDNEKELEPRAVYKNEMKPEHKIFFEFVIKFILTRQERRHIANYMDLTLMECLYRGKQINWPSFIIQLLDRVVNGTKAHAIPYGFILTAVLTHFGVPAKKAEMATTIDYFWKDTLMSCDYIVTGPADEPGSSRKQPVNSKVRTLVQERELKDMEILRLKSRLIEVEAERDALKAELAKEKEKNEGVLHQMLSLLQTKNPTSSAPSQP